jgi:FkbM family methyltransferase
MEKKYIAALDSYLEFPEKLTNSGSLVRRYETFKEKEEDTWFWLKYLADSKGYKEFVDIGCNVGVYSLTALRLFPGVKVFSFDPLLANCECTLLMCKQNCITHNAIVVQQAFLADRPGVVGLFDQAGVPGVTAGTTKERSAAATTISDAGFALPISSFACLSCANSSGVVKIDVDGAEFDVLSGFSETQICNIDSLAVEVDLFDPEDAARILVLLKTWGLKSSKANLEVFDYLYRALVEGNVDDVANYESVIDHLNCWPGVVDDGLIDYLEENNFHENRINRKIGQKKNGLNYDAERFALNMFFFR